MYRCTVSCYGLPVMYRLRHKHTARNPDSQTPRAPGNKPQGQMCLCDNTA